jgi:hypothetical protein
VLILTALPLQLGFFLLLFQLSKVSVDVYQTMTQAAPGRTILETDVDVDVAAMIRRASQDFVSKGLERSDDPRATAWREQLPLLEVVDVTSALERFPVRHQVSNVSSSRWDATNGIEWTFSHDKMLFEGREPATGVRRGLWGTSGKDSEQVFREIPLGDMTASTLYAIDEERQQQHALLSLEAGENFVSRPVRAADRLFVLSNRRLAAFVADRDASSPFAPPTLDWQVELSASDPRPVAVGVVELLDGWLVSAYRYAGPEYDGFEELVPHEQTIYYVESGSQAILVGRRLVEGAHITAGSAPAVPKASWWLSPALYAIGRLPAALLDTGRTRAPDYGLVPGPRLFYALAAGSLMLSLLLGAWWLRRTRPGAARRGWWLASCAVFGLPAFLSLVCLESRSAR